MNKIILQWQIKLLCLCITLTCALSTFAFENNPNPIPPDCTLLTPAGATATSGNAAMAIDGNGGTRWESAFNDAQSLTVDLGASVNVNSVSIDWEAANAKDYILSGSDDNENWTVISTKSNMPMGARTDVINGINASYRYLKMQGVLRNLPYGYSIWEFYVCSTAIVAPTCTVAAAASATASSGNAALAIDDLTGSRWESAFSDPQTLTVDMGVVDFVKKVTISWEAANAKDYILSGSVDGTEWVTIGTYTNMPGGNRTDNITNIDGNYRYLRMYGTARNLTYGYSIFEFDVCVGVDDEPEEPEPPLVCDSPLTADFVTVTSGADIAGLAIDGNHGTRWASSISPTASLTVDMGELDTIEFVKIDWETANAKNYTLSGSLDGTNWTLIATKNNMPAYGDHRIDDIVVGADYRYLKMDGLVRNAVNGGYYGYSIWEFEVCGDVIEGPEGPEPLVCDSPLAADSAIATSGNAAAAVDGALGTRWESAATDPQTLTIDMGEVDTIDFVKIDWETANAKDYTLSGSVDNENWTLIATKTNMPPFGNHRIDDIVVGAEYRYLKMDATARNTPYGYSIYEFGICGQAPTDYTPVPAQIEAENWYAMIGVQTEPCADTGGGIDVSFIDDNDWMEYAIEVTTAGEYTIDARVSSIAATGIIEYSSNGSILGTVNIPNTGGWQVWQTISKTVYLQAGQQKLRVKAAAEQYNVNWIEIKDPCFTWTGTAGNDWANASNWCGGSVPTAYSDVVLAAGANPVISSGMAYANSLTLNAGATLTVATGATLSVVNEVAIAPIATLTIQDNGALVQVNNVENTGKIVQHKISNPLYRLDYTLWSAPVTGQTLRTFAMATSNNRFYEYAYDTADAGATYVEGYWPVDPLTTYFEPAKAYLIRMPNVDDASGYNTGANPISFDGIFNGVPNNGPYTPALSQQGNCFTAVGNPYASPISVYDFLTNNSTKLATDTGIWLWRKRNGSDNTSYLTLNLSGLVAPPGDTNGNGELNDELSAYYQGNNTSWLLAPGQGFIVRAKENLAEPVLSFTNSMRRATPATQAFFRSGASTASRYWLNMTSQSGSGSQALIAYMEQATTGIDYGYDSKTFTTGISLYSTAADNKLAIQARPQFETSDVVPMGFTAPAAGQYTISIDHMDGIFAQGQEIYLKDLQEGIIRNLGTNSYTFTTEAGTFEGRFEVVYQANALGTATPEMNANVLVYHNESGINISATDTIASVTVFDLLGRNIFTSQSINENTFSTGSFSATHHAVIVKVKLANGCETTKKIIL
ncbi:discoidin domain-containing protein [Flavobacterium sp. RHBU_24]|uniref:galactose-binding domain-containing protein n=1 Tax=Flavobacterium sp. RHBU_24 TaxID=3391185 RepID=UPI003985473B